MCRGSSSLVYVLRHSARMLLGKFCWKYNTQKHSRLYDRSCNHTWVNCMRRYMCASGQQGQRQQQPGRDQTRQCATYSIEPEKLPSYNTESHNSQRFVSLHKNKHVLSIAKPTAVFVYKNSRPASVFPRFIQCALVTERARAIEGRGSVGAGELRCRFFW